MGGQEGLACVWLGSRLGALACVAAVPWIVQCLPEYVPGRRESVPMIQCAALPVLALILCLGAVGLFWHGLTELGLW